MPELSGVRPRRLLRALQRLGFAIARQKGSHVQLKKGNLLVTVPVHSSDLNPQTLRSILRQAKLREDELAAVL